MYRESGLPLGLVYTTFNFMVRALDALTGALRWQHELPLMGSAQLRARDGRCFVLLGARIQALDAATGTLLWSVQLPVDMPARDERLEVLDGVVICSAGTELFAVGAEDGTLRWKSHAYTWRLDGA